MCQKLQDVRQSRFAFAEEPDAGRKIEYRSQKTGDQKEPVQRHPFEDIPVRGDDDGHGVEEDEWLDGRWEFGDRIDDGGGEHEDLDEETDSVFHIPVLGVEDRQGQTESERGEGLDQQKKRGD